MSDDDNVFRYKPRKHTLDIDDKGLLDKIKNIALLRPTKAEAAAVLGVNRNIFARFLADEPDALAAWEDGREIAKTSLRRTLHTHAKTDPGTARFLSKQYLKMSDDPSKNRVDLAVAEIGAVAVMKASEARARIKELRDRFAPPPIDVTPKPQRARKRIAGR